MNDLIDVSFSGSVLGRETSLRDMSTADSITGQQGVLRREAQTWLLRLTSGQANTHDAEAFRHWCGLSQEHAQAFAQARLLWQNLGPAVEAVQKREQLRATQSSPLRMSRRAFLGGAVAASAACLLLRPPLHLWPSWSDLTADYRTGKGEQRQVELASGVVVEMNTQTAINVRTRLGKPIGMDLITGEVQIVTAAKLAEPFAVFAASGRVLATGATQCNVRCTGPEVQVTCLNGLTQLECHGRSVAIRPAEQISYGAQGVGTIAAVDTDVAMAWRRRLLIFDNQPLADVVAEINRYRPGELILMNDALAAHRVHARFSLNQLADVAVMIRDAFGARLTTLPGGIVLLS